MLTKAGEVGHHLVFTFSCSLYISNCRMTVVRKVSKDAAPKWSRGNEPRSGGFTEKSEKDGGRPNDIFLASQKMDACSKYSRELSVILSRHLGCWKRGSRNKLKRKPRWGRHLPEALIFVILWNTTISSQKILRKWKKNTSQDV